MKDFRFTPTSLGSRVASLGRIVQLSAIAWMAGSCGSGCRGGEPPPALSTDLETPASASAEPAPTKQEKPADGRDLWFAAGPGRDAILARERRDYEAAVAHLDRLLARSDLSPDDRGVAELLRGLEELRLGKYASAAEHFARAAQAPALRILPVRLALLEAQARLDAGDPQAARKRLESIPEQALADSPLQDAVLLAKADALARTDKPDAARQAYERHLSQYGSSPRRFEAQVKLARLLAASESVKDKAGAVELYEELLMRSPLSDYGEEAEQVLPALRKAAGVKRNGAQQRQWERDLAVARVEALLDRRRYGQAVEAADKVLRTRGIELAERCKVLYAKGSAIFKQRERAKARPVFEQAAKACGKSSTPQVSYEVKSRYQAARGAYAQGRYDDAARAFERLATDRPKNSYADDAWLLAGESWSEHGDADRARAAFEQAVAVNGDMKHEARRRLLLMAFAADEHDVVLELTDKALQDKTLGPSDTAKLHYLRGRALAEQGKNDQAQQAWVAAVAADPLDYPALQALNRLGELSDEALAAGVAELEGASTEGIETLRAEDGAAARALLLARLGLGDEARQELRHAKVNGWPAVAVMHQAGLYAEAQRMIASLGQSWRIEPPGGPGRRRWELAHPRPFAKLIAQYQESHSVPDLLAFAVMQTESRFDPGVTSWAGARGLIQLMPSTAKSVADTSGRTYDPDTLFDPATNLDLGMIYLGRLVQRFGGGDPAVALAVPSYNAGAGAVDRWLDERGDWELDLFIEAIPYDETRHYTQRVLGRWWAYRWLYGEGDPADRIPRLPLTIPKK